MLSLNYTFTLSGRGVRPAQAWLGAHVALVIESGGGISASERTRREVVGALDRVYECLVRVAGEVEEREGSVEGRVAIQVPVDNAGAAGLARHGVWGISVGSGIVRGMVERWESGEGGVDHVFYYEMGRNIWRRWYNRKIDWCCDGRRECWGWWTVGMCNAIAVIVPVLTGERMWYFGRDGGMFRDGMVGELGNYIRYARGKREPFEAWRMSLMPWKRTESVNDLMTGLIVRSFEQFGGEQWIIALFREMANVPDINATEAGGTNYQAARDNIYRIWSLAAKADLANVFTKELLWEISSTARTEIATRFPDANTLSLDMYIDA